MTSVNTWNMDGVASAPRPSFLPAHVYIWIMVYICGGVVSMKATIHNATLLLRELKSYTETSCVGMKSVEKRNRTFYIVCCMDWI